MSFQFIKLAFAFTVTGVLTIGCGPVRTPLRPPAEERLSFQASDPWNPRVNVNAAVAMVYGIDVSQMYPRPHQKQVASDEDDQDAEKTAGLAT